MIKRIAVLAVLAAMMVSATIATQGSDTAKAASGSGIAFPQAYGSTWSPR